MRSPGGCAADNCARFLFNEPVAGPCRGIHETGERPRRASWSAAQDAVWSPWSAVKSLRIVAGANTATCHHGQTVLRALAAGGTTGEYTAGKFVAAEAAGRARQAWLTMARALETVTTDSRCYISAEAAEAEKLALCSGRLAYADAQWTPPDGPSHAHRDAAALAIGEQGVNRSWLPSARRPSRPCSSPMPTTRSSGRQPEPGACSCR